jgi:hypothetical protein
MAHGLRIQAGFLLAVLSAGLAVGAPVVQGDSAPGFSANTNGLGGARWLMPGATGDAPASEPTNAVRELPPAPGSLSLVFSALASLGAYQGVRSLRKLHFGAAPDWYHTGGPRQIGHVVVWDLEFPLLACDPFDCVIDVRPRVRARAVFAEPTPLRSDVLLVVESPRAPPGA